MAQSRVLQGTTRVFLLGKTGHGKSSTGNTILGWHAFKTSSNSESETNEVLSAWSRIGAGTVQVVDGPGGCDTRLSRGDAAKKMVADMSKGLFLCPNGFDALVMVCRYGVRFTEEEAQSVEALKSVFGPQFIKDFGIIVFTNGEHFDMENEESEKTREEWLGNQKGPIKDWMKESVGRCVLFRNIQKKRNKDQEKILFQKAQLLKQRRKQPIHQRNVRFLGKRA